MTITLELNSLLDDFLPDDAPLGRGRLDLAEGGTVQAVIDRLGIPPHRVHLAYVNGRLLDRSLWEDRALCDGDVVALWPLLAGG